MRGVGLRVKPSGDSCWSADWSAAFGLFLAGLPEHQCLLAESVRQLQALLLLFLHLIIDSPQLAFPLHLHPPIIFQFLQLIILPLPQMPLHPAKQAGLHFSLLHFLSYFEFFQPLLHSCHAAQFQLSIAHLLLIVLRIRSYSDLNSSIACLFSDGLSETNSFGLARRRTLSISPYCMII